MSDSPEPRETYQDPPRPRDPYPNPYQRPYARPRPVAGRRSEGLADLLERILDKGLVVAGDIQLNLLDIELITIKVRLLLASADTAQQMGIDWWRHDPFLSDKDRDLAKENAALRSRLEDLVGPSGAAGDRQLARENALLREHVRRLQAALEQGSSGTVETRVQGDRTARDASEQDVESHLEVDQTEDDGPDRER